MIDCASADSSLQDHLQRQVSMPVDQLRQRHLPRMMTLLAVQIERPVLLQHPSERPD
jgi:hypothetical protein